MGDVFVVYRISTDMDKFDEVKKAIEEQIKPKEIKEEEVGFGIKVLKVLVTVSDEKGSGEVEAKLNAIEGIENVDVENVGRL